MSRHRTGQPGSAKILVPINEAARRLGISPTTLRRLEKDDEVKGYGLRVYHTPGGQRRYSVEEIERFFLTSGFSGTIGAGDRPTVLVIDCINAFTNRQSPLHFDWDTQIVQINRILDAARQGKCPVIFSHSYYEESDATLKLWAKKIKGIEALKRDSTSVRLDPRIAARAGDVHLYSKHVSVYYETPLLETLERLRCDTLIICGFSTSASVRTVAVESIQYGIRPIIPAEAVGDRDEHMHRNNLADMERKFADVVSTAEVIRYLENR